MKQIIKYLMIINIILIVNQNFAQEKKNKVDIQIPSSPGLTIIGVQNAEISKPGDYTGLYSSLISPIVSENGTVPANLAVEFSPYYLESRNITVNELSKTNLFRDLKVSIASTNVKHTDSSVFSRMGIGLKTIILNGNLGALPKSKFFTLTVPNDINELVTKLENPDVFGALDTTDITVFTNEMEKELNKFKKAKNTEFVNQYEALINKVTKILRNNKKEVSTAIIELEKLKKEVEKLVKVDDSIWDYSIRTGSFLEIAGAFALDFPNNKFNNSKLSRWGIWLNYTYRFDNKKRNIDLGAILRLSNYSFDPSVEFDNDAYFTDFGISINYQFLKNKFVVTGEYLGKFGITELRTTDKDNKEFSFKSVFENKWNITLGYRITEKVIWNISLSELRGDSDYLSDNPMQFHMGINAALVPLKK